MTTIESPSGYTKEIVYDRDSHDYAMFLDGELIGYARTYHEAEVTLNQLVYGLLASDLHRSASELDGGSDADEIAADMAERCANCGGRHMCAPDGHTFRCVTCGAIWRSALCPSCGDALTSDEPRCAACRESEPLTLPQAVALAVGGADVCAACRCTDPALPGGEFCAYHAHYALTTPFALGG